MNLYDYKVKDTKENDVSLEKYKGKVLLIVNTATACGLTGQYEGLQKLYEKYKSKNFEILDFPCNQFLNQAPGTNEEVKDFCQAKYKTTFETFGKIQVNGEHADPLYKYLKVQQPDDLEDPETPAFKKILSDIGQVFLGSDIKWNFTKFLISKEGKVVTRFAPTYKPEDLEQKIEQLL